MSAMKKLIITWQRLINEDEATCPRCGGTERELEKAVKELKGMGIAVELEKKALSPAEFKSAPLMSNRIVINGKPLEDWLKAGSGSSKCCEECGDEECRTVEVNDQSYATIPAELIVQAGLEASKRA